MGFIEDLGLLFVSAQIRVRLKFPHDGSICTLNHGHIGSGMHLQDFVVVDVGGEVSRLPCLSRPCSWQLESSSQAPPGGDNDRDSNYRHDQERGGISKSGEHPLRDPPRWALGKDGACALRQPPEDRMGPKGAAQRDCGKRDGGTQRFQGGAK